MQTDYAAYKRYSGLVYAFLIINIFPFIVTTQIPKDQSSHHDCQISFNAKVKYCVETFMMQ